MTHISFSFENVLQKFGAMRKLNMASYGEELRD